MPTHQLWSQISPVVAHQILLVTQDSNKKLYRTALEVISPRLGRRPSKVLEMPKVERHAGFALLLSKPQLEVLSFNIFSHWLVETQTDMLNTWLDALGIPHNEQGCADSFPGQPDEEKIRKAVDVLLEKFDPVLVTIYLHAFNEIDDTHWPLLSAILATDPRLKPEGVALPGVASATV